ncbi:hypothetical protein [Neptuniibacter sp. QD34_54]|uniref:hypothetical protein n=1 Tax=Neptuniibacter sp. QD34_54 TaxID=3398208 RepID=UPI0039F5CBC7
MSLNQGSDSFISSNRAYIIAAAVVALALILFLFNPFQEAPLKTEYHSGRDAFTVAPGQLPEPPRSDTASTQQSKPSTTPQAAAIEAQLAEAKKLSAGAEERQQRINELNQLVAKLDAAQGADRENTQVVADQRTLQIREELDELQARTERLQKRVADTGSAGSGSSGSAGSSGSE